MIKNQYFEKSKVVLMYFFTSILMASFFSFLRSIIISNGDMCTGTGTAEYGDYVFCRQNIYYWRLFALDTLFYFLLIYSAKHIKSSQFLYGVIFILYFAITCWLMLSVSNLKI
ncbi:hypothetical protein KW795_00035 [Candidatus Microgenomates bacterium]|nr:hypothetical protein [Candidatus Microgenomates bacterium]